MTPRQGSNPSPRSQSSARPDTSCDEFECWEDAPVCRCIPCPTGIPARYLHMIKQSLVNYMKVEIPL
eukprot:1393918-Amorphochlora_amoeboformis.AAC.1